VAPDPEIQKTLVSFLGRELRSLQDVRIVESGQSHLVHMIAMPIVDNNNNLIAYAISTVFTISLSAELVSREIGEMVPQETMDKITQFIETKQHFLRHYLDMSAPNQTGLREACSAIITTLDTELFEPQRKRLREEQGQN
jgi:hypothetical protein